MNNNDFNQISKQMTIAGVNFRLS